MEIDMNKKNLKHLLFALSMAGGTTVVNAAPRIGANVAVTETLGEPSTLTTSVVSSLPKLNFSNNTKTTLSSSGLSASQKTNVSSNNGFSAQSTTKSLPGLFTQDSNLTTAKGKTASADVSATTDGTSSSYNKEVKTLNGDSVIISLNSTPTGASYNKTIINSKGQKSTVSSSTVSPAVMN